jgi:hypothetical protein
LFRIFGNTNPQVELGGKAIAFPQI